MDLSKSYQISVDYKDRRSLVNWDNIQFAEIIFVDKTHPTTPPLLYQLNESKLSLDEILDLHRSNALSFIFVGEILYIDKKKKQVSLINKNVLTYNHLVIASGKKPILTFQDAEFYAALQALIDACRVKPKIPNSFPCDIKKAPFTIPSKIDAKFAASDKSIFSKDELNIEKIVHPYIIDGKPPFTSCNLNAFNSRLYEVHT